MNLQPSEAEAGFDIRVPPNVDAEALERRLVEEWAPAARNMSFEVISWPPVSLCPFFLRQSSFVTREYVSLLDKFN